MLIQQFTLRAPASGPQAWSLTCELGYLKPWKQGKQRKEKKRVATKKSRTMAKNKKQQPLKGNTGLVAAGLLLSVRGTPLRPGKSLRSGEHWSVPPLTTSLALSRISFLRKKRNAISLWHANMFSLSTHLLMDI